MIDYPKPPFPKQKQPMPGFTRKMEPIPDHGEQSYKGAGRLAGKKAIITGADSGIGRAVAIAFAREGADVLISYLSEHEHADESKRLVEDAGRKGVLLAGDIKHAGHCRAIVDKAVSELGGVDILVNNAAHQASFKELEDISEEEWDLTFKVNIHAMPIVPPPGVCPNGRVRPSPVGISTDPTVLPGLTFHQRTPTCTCMIPEKPPPAWSRYGSNAR